MASPIVSPDMRMVKRSGECLGVLIEEGLDGDDMQATIDDTTFRQELMRFWKSRGRSITPVTETPSQARARQIMGQNFHGPDQVMKRFGVWYTEAQLLQLADTLPSEEVLRACKDTHILVAGYPLTGLEIHKRMKQNAYEQDWYENEDFARKTKVRLRWLLLRKTDVPNSRSKAYRKQTALLDSQEETSIFCEVLFGMNLHFAETGERLHETYCVRCQDVISNGDRVYVGHFGQSGWYVDDGGDGDRNSDIGLASSRN